MPLNVGEGLLRETFATLRSCGAGKAECVAYWSGPLDHSGVVDALHHPDHRASPFYYEIDDHWLTRVWIELAQRRRAIRAQVHTHAGPAFHSRLDDDFPIVATPGFLSLVLPRFALGEPTLDEAYLAELDEVGQWHELDPRKSLKVSP